jgi:hypothetical protein
MEAIMQDPYGGVWSDGLKASGASLHPLRDLNRGFLKLAADRGEWARGPGDIAARVAPLTPQQREAAADCPYALFDLRFRDAAHWQARFREAHRWAVADLHDPSAATVDFVRLALFYAWHVAATAGLTAQLLLGMSLDTAATFRAMSLDSLPFLARTEAAHLSARWSSSAAYWNALMCAASAGDGAALRRAQLHGLQLAAASRLLYR